MINLRSNGKVLFIILFLYFLNFLPQTVIAQLAVDNTTYTPQQLVQDIFLGNGVDVSNVTITVADNRQLGYFTNSNSNLQISEGIMLSTGYTDEMSIAGNNTDDGYSSDSGGFCAEGGLCGPGDTDLDAILAGTGSTSFDAVVLEFDFIPLSNTIEFNYVFASEEYNEYVCSEFNDVFAFLLTGVTTPFPTTNIATVPGSAPPLPVAINSVNNGTVGDFGLSSNCSGTQGSLAYSSLFIDNLGPGGVFGGFNGGPYVQFDGITVTLTATATVIPCETYHIKLALADAFDGVWDSGVFLEANSFTSGIVDVDVSTASVDPLVVEDCTGDVATVTLTLQETQATDYIIPLDIFGTAINGIDYITIPSDLTILAGQNSATFLVDPIDDGLPEGVETVMIGVQTSVCTSDTITVYITQNPPIPTPNLMCNTSLNSIEFTWDADPGVLSYEISLDGGTTWQAPMPGPTSHLVSGLSQGDMATIDVRPVGACNVGNVTSLTCTAQACTPGVTLASSAPDITCGVNSITLTPTPSGIQGNASYQWSTGVTDNGGTGTITAMGDYTVTISDDFNSVCTATASISIGEDFMMPMVNITAPLTEFNCSQANSILLTANPTVQGTASYQWSQGFMGTNMTASAPSADTYTVTVTDSDNGCVATASITLTEDFTDPVMSLIPSANEFNCEVTEMILETTGTYQGTPSYVWSAGTLPVPTQDSALILAPGSFSVTVTDGDNGCTASASVTLGTDYLTPSVSLTSSQPQFTCATNSMNLTALPVTQGFTSYAWSPGAVGIGDVVTITSAGDYTVTITDEDNGCTATNTINVPEDPTPPTIILSASEPEFTCNTVGNINLNVFAITQGAPSYQWSTGVSGTGTNVSVSAMGDYSVTLTDSANSCTSTATINIGEDMLAPIVSLTSDEPEFNCNVNSIVISPTPTVQGTASYQWSAGVTDNGGTGTITSPGDYTVTITDSDNGCTATAMITLNEDVLTPAVSLASDETEFNCNINSIVLTPTPTVQGTASYQWSIGVTDNGGTGTITSPGDYTVTITDSDNGCTATTTITLGEDTQVPAVALASDEPEFNCTITSIVLTPTPTVQGTASYQWSAGVTDNGGTGTITSPGDYTVTITDSDNGCTASTSINVGVDPLNPMVSITSDEPEFNCDVASIVLTATPMVQGMASYEWSTSIADVSNTLTISTMGTYTVTITDSDNGCSVTSSITITEDFQAPVVTLSSDEPEFNCNINSIILTPTPTSQGTPSYQWSAGVTDNGGTGTITAMGNYTVTITDADNGCTSTAIISIGEDFQSPGITLSSDEPAFNCNINTIVLTPAPTVQGTPSYQWSTGVTDIGGAGSITSMGDYTVTITDSDNGCTTTTSISVGEDFTPPTATIVPSGTQLYCTVTNITLDATTSTSQGALTYVWSSGVTGAGPIVSVTTSGNYTVTITDINGCTDETSVNIQDVPPVMVVELASSDATCNGSDDGSVSVVASGGDGNYSYAWNGDAAGSMDMASGLSPNIYIVTVTDGLSCTATYSYEVTEPLAIIPTLTQTDVTCAGLADGTATASATGGTITGAYGFAWGTVPVQNTSTVTGLTAGTYTVTVTDDNMCTATESIMVNEPLVLSLQIVGTDVNCAGENNGSATVTASDGTPGYTYLWNNIPPSLTATASSLVAGTYTVTVTDLNDCTATESVVINEPMAISVTAIATQIQTDCEFPDGAAQVSASNGAGAYTYAWGTIPGQTGTDASNLTAGTYFVTATDANGCTASTSVDIGSTFTINPVETIVNVDCNGSATGSISIVTTGDGMNGPFTYTWNDGSNDNPYNNLTAGIYTVVVSDINNCSVTQPYVITEPTELTITVIDVNDSSCSSSADGSITIAVNGGTGNYTYTWDGAAVGQDDTVDNIPFGNYVVMVEDENGCMATETISVGTPAPIIITLLGTTPANCTACDGTANVSISGGTAPYTIVWPNGNNSPMPTNLCSGVNTITVLDANSCSETLDVIVDNVTTLVIDDISVSDTDCPDSCDGAASVSASGGLPPYSYIWDANAGSLEDEAFDLCSGSYGVTVTDQNGCIVSDIANIASPDPLYMELGSIDVVCFGEQNGAVTIDSVSGGTGPYGYSLDNELFIFDSIFSFQYSGDYTVYVEDANGCLDSSMTFVYEPPQLLVTAFPLDTLINLGESVELNAIPNQNNTTLLWTPGDSLSCIDCPNPITNTYATTEYTVLVTDTILGCTTTENLLVRINKDRDIYVPNAFTPNNDGANDFVSVYAGGDVARIKTFRVFDRWGEMVFERLDFEANSPELGWDGYLNGKRMNPAVYVYFVEAEFIDGHVEKVAGDVTLVD